MLLPKSYLLLIWFLLMAVSSFGQIKKAHRLFERGAITQAAELYKIELENDSSNVSAMVHLAHCFRLKKDYPDAEEWYRKALEVNPEDDELVFFYAKMLYLLGLYEQSADQLRNYLQLSPGDTAATKLLQWIDVVKNYPENDDFSVVKCPGVNSSYADFAPVLYNGKLVFTSERNKQSDHEKPEIDEKPFTDIWFASFADAQNRAFETSQPFSGPFNTRYHDGPISFSSTGKTAYFTRVSQQEKGRDKLNRLQVFYSHRVDDKWSNPEPLPFNDRNYAVAHAVVAENDSMLIFSSDMPGGFGGMDLYRTRLENGNWSTPENLGSGVNSAGDEVFPHYFEDKLYFASNGWPGLGGLDLFVVKIDSLQDKPQNLYAPINSAWDDLSVFFSPKGKIFFASDRPGGLGRDDIYALEEKVPENTFRQISGLLEYHNRPAAFTSLLLKDHHGNILQRTVTDESGSFALKYVQSEVNYSLSLDIAEKDRLNNFTLYFLNNRHEKVQKVVPSAHGDFKFELLPPDDHDNLQLLAEEDPGLLLIDIQGKVYKSTPGDFTDRIEVQIYNADGKLLSRTFVENDGQFIFRHLIPDDQYIFRLLSDDESLKMVILDDRGKELARLTRSGREYIYNRFAPGDPVLSLLNEQNVTIKISPDDHFAIPNIYYAFDSWQLNDQSRRQLDKLMMILQKNPSTAVNITSHTDSRASDQYNLELSEKRAAEVVRYLRQKGIESRRLSGRGYGEQQLVNHCKNDVHCSEAEHAENRRTAFTLYSLEE